MVMPYTVVSIVLCFVFSLIALPYWMRRCSYHNLLITDAQKYPAKRVPYLAGLVVVFGAVSGMLFYIAAQTFLGIDGNNVVVLLAAISAILIALMIGVVDDLLGERIGLRKYQKLILTFFVSLPVVVVNAGHKLMNFPFFGAVQLGNFYSFFVVPVGIVGASNGFNMLAGLNGLEAGMGLIILGTLGFLTFKSGSIAASVIALCMFAAILPFFWYNKFPARILPGNGFTYAVGATIAVVAIVGDVERAAIILFIPYFVELILKSRGRFVKESLARPLADGSIVNKYKSWYSLNHVVISLLRAIKGRAREWEVALILICVELFFAGITVYLHYGQI